jgi:replication-associated recombination protein RarA
MKTFFPTSLADFLFSDPRSQQAIADILNGFTDFPAEKRGILSYGPPGTGKTELVRFIPELFEQSHYPAPRSKGWGTLKEAVHETTCTAGMQPIRLFEDLLHRRSLSNSYTPKKGLHYEIYDEIDKLSPNTRDSLKGLMTNPQFADTVFLLTSNNPSVLGSALLSRLVPVAMNHGTPDQLLPLGRRVLSVMGGSGEISDAELLAIAQATGGDLREFIPEVRKSGRKALLNGASHV